jgi:hypothetical protein
MKVEKRIITHTAGTATYSNGFIFGDYGWSLEKYQRLAEIAKQDFPSLKDSDIEIDRVRVSTYMKEFAYVRFPLPAGTEKEGYTALDRWDFS